MQQGPNVKRLITRRMSTIMVPAGGGTQSAIAALTEPGKLGAVAQEATNWVLQAIAAVKVARNTPFADDETIAAEILNEIHRRETMPQSKLPGT